MYICKNRNNAAQNAYWRLSFGHRMAQKKIIRQPPSVPFLWEEKPGIAKKHWKPGVCSRIPALPPPVKLIASVPFNWEEEPGKPLSCFSESPTESAVRTPHANAVTQPSSFIHSRWDDNHKCGNDVGGENNFGDNQSVIFNLDIKSFSFETEDSFSAKPSLMANCLVSSEAISTVFPAEKTTSVNDISGQSETSSSPDSETDSSTSSNAAGISSFEGTAFLECLFPLYSPKSGFLGKVALTKEESLTPAELNSRDFDRENNSSITLRRPPTLAELIMMSRRRSCQRKAVQMRKQNLSMKFMDGKAFGCCIFGTSIKMIEGLQMKMRQPRLKLV